MNILIDGRHLELLDGTGIKTYGLGLIEAIGGFGGSSNVLVSRGGLKKNRTVNTDALALFQEQIGLRSKFTKFNVPLIVKTLLGIPETATTAPLQQGMLIFKGQEQFRFIQQSAIHVSSNCYQIADYMHYLKRRMKIIVPGMDIWHATYFTPIEIKDTVKVTTIHDLVPLRLPYTTLNDKGLYYSQVQDAVDTSNLIFCVSQNTADDLMNIFSVPAEKIVVTYQPATLDSRALSEQEIVSNLNIYNLNLNDYLLFVSAIEPKKNLRRLIKAYLSLDTNLPLVVVGKKAWLAEEELKGIEADNIHFIGYASYEELTALYQGARCLIVPSLYEGFGLPIVEAMSQGCPVISSNTSCLPEIAGDAALYVDPYDIQDIAAKIQNLLSDDALAKDLREKGRVQAQKYSMESYYGTLKQAYDKALDAN